MTCPIAKTTTVALRVRPAADFAITRIAPKLDKLGQSLRATAALLELEPVEIRVERWSDLDVGKGMGSSTADIVAAARALAAVAGRPLSTAELAKIATSIESSDGSMHPGMVAFNQKTGHVLEEFSWWPQFRIIMITPAQVLSTESAAFTGKEKLGRRFDEILNQLRAAAVNRDARAFALAASRSARLNQRFVPNPCYPLFADRLDELGAVGLNVGHTGTLLGLLFDARDPGGPPGGVHRAAEDPAHPAEVGECRDHPHPAEPGLRPR